MLNNYKIIDEKSWDRATHCKIFRNYIEPMFCVTFETEITNFRQKIKDQGFSFTISMVYAICKTANEIKNFRYRFMNGKVVLFDKIDTAFTYLNKETNLFKVINVSMLNNIEEYVKVAKKIVESQIEYFSEPLKTDVFMCSAMPWVKFTHISHTISCEKDNSIPLFDWGKFYEREGKLFIPISVQAHHSFVDGVHIGEFVESLQKYFDEF